MSRGRPRSFDQEAVIEKAMTAFWKQGYENVSIDGLCKITNLTKPSFYNAFGSKEDLFLICLTQYQLKYAEPLLGLLLKSEDPLSGIEKMLTAASNRFRDSRLPAGCLIMTGALEAKGKTKKIDQKLDELQKQMLKLIEGYFDQHTGTSSARHLAQYLLAQLYALAMFSKTNAKLFDFNGFVRDVRLALQIKLG